MSHTIRRFRPEDRDKVIAFAAGLPEHDLLFLSRDVREPRVVAAWLDAIGSGEIDSLIAEDNGAIVATAALVHDPLSWSAHVGEVRLLVAPGRRGSGLGSDLLQGIFMIAKERGLAKLTANPDVIVLCHGGPIAEPDDAAYVLARTEGIVGFFGASSMERLPTEVAMTENMRRFKSIPVGGGKS